MSSPQFAACARCENEGCSVIVIVPAVRDGMKSMDRENQRLSLICPACDRLFSVAFAEFEYREVTDDQLLRGFIGG
jgi:hypothetical protein